MTVRPRMRLHMICIRLPKSIFQFIHPKLVFWQYISLFCSDLKIGVFDICGLMPQRHTFRLIVNAFHQYDWSVVKFFLWAVRAAQDTGKSAVLALAPPTLETSRIFHDSRVRYPQIGFAIKLWRSVVYNWSYSAFRYYMKNKSFLFGREPPMQHWAQTEATNVFWATIDRDEISHGSVDPKSGGRKKQFSTRSRGPPLPSGYGRQ